VERVLPATANTWTERPSQGKRWDSRWE